MLVAWTGHRPDLFNDPAAAEATVDALSRDIVEREPVTGFVVGGQRGVDTWAARAALRLGLPLRLILPLAAAEFSHEWTNQDQQALQVVMAGASELRVVGGDPEQAYRERNRLLATEADLLVAVWTGVAGGGTAETIALACENGTALREVLLTPSSRSAGARGRGI